jgi:hypothetical protein
MIGELLSSNFVLLIIVPAAIAFAILWLCKYYDVSLIPRSLKREGKRNFKLPKLERKKVGNSDKYNWTVEDDDESDKDDDESDDEQEYVEIKRLNNSGRNMYD